MSLYCRYTDSDDEEDIWDERTTELVFAERTPDINKVGWFSVLSLVITKENKKRQAG